MSAIHIMAAGTDEKICGGVKCSGKRCNTHSTVLLYLSASSDYSKYWRQAFIKLKRDNKPLDGKHGPLSDDIISFGKVHHARYAALCRTGVGGQRDHLVVDYVSAVATNSIKVPKTCSMARPTLISPPNECPAQHAGRTINISASVSTCLEVDFGGPTLATGIKYEVNLVSPAMHIFTSAAQVPDYTSFQLLRSVTLLLRNYPGGGHYGKTKEDVVEVQRPGKLVRFVAFCPDGPEGRAISHHDLVMASLVIDEKARCPAVDTAQCSQMIQNGIVFQVSASDGRSWKGDGKWRDIVGAAVGTIGTKSAVRYVSRSSGGYFLDLDGGDHFDFDGSASVLNFKADFSISVMLKVPPGATETGFGHILSRRPHSDYRQHHGLFFDTRQPNFLGTWKKGQSVVVLYMGGGNAANTRWAYTEEVILGDWNQITFTISKGVICPYVNGSPSGRCSRPMPSGARQINSERLEIGGENTYAKYRVPMGISSVTYYQRALSPAEVRSNFYAGRCLELMVSPPPTPKRTGHDSSSTQPLWAGSDPPLQVQVCILGAGAAIIWRKVLTGRACRRRVRTCTTWRRKTTRSSGGVALFKV
jgi:hypothetical protein